MRLFWQLMVFCTVLTWADSALSQRRPIADDTLGNERSIVTPQDDLGGLPGDRIGGGARRGDNLFHSFREFGVDVGRSVYFDDPGVRNILSRVTGGNVSEIFGKLGVSGNANLFLINPSGIVFGEGASLNVNGSFVGTTANGIQFGNQGFFNVSDPNAPSLLTVQPSAFLFNQIQGGAIENRSIAPAGQNPSGQNVFGLRVPDGQSLLLVGGNIIMDGEEFGGRLNALGGRVEIGGLSETGAVLLNADGSLGFPFGVGRSDVVLSNGIIDVAAGDGGNISINARNIDILDRSLLQAGIFSGLGTVDSQAGNIVLNGTGEIQVRQSSFIINNVGADGIGNSGNIDITAGSLFVTDGVSVQAVIKGQGNAGNVSINARNQIVFDNSTAFSTVESGGIGRGGNINIDTGSLVVRNGAQLLTSTAGQGDAGSVIINANDRVVFDDGAAAFSSVGSVNSDGMAVGDGGDVQIRTGSLEVLNGAALVANTYGQGDAGDVIINANGQVVFDGNSTDGETFSSAFSNVEEGGTGNGGNIEINTNSLEVLNTAQLIASTEGQGNAGNVTINANGQVVFDNSAAFSRVQAGGIGRGGNVVIDTSTLAVRNGAQLVAGVEGQGTAGDVIINASDEVVFDGTSVDGTSPSAASSGVQEGGIGRGGNIAIDTASLVVRDGAQLLANTRGRGDAGNVTLNVNDQVVFDNGDAISRVEAGGIGRGGNIAIDTASLVVRNGAQLLANTRGQGDAGSVIINASNEVVFDGSSADGQSFSAAFSDVREGSIGRGGNIAIDTASLVVRDGAQLITATAGQGDAGNVTITSDEVVFDNGDVISSVEVDGIGQGGNIAIDTASLVVRDSAQLVTSTAGQGDAGSVTITSDEVVFDGTSADGEFPSAAISRVEESGIGRGDNISINTGSLIVRNGAQLLANTKGQGNAGSVIIDADDRVSIEGVGSDGRSSGLFTSTSPRAQGQGGDITIDANSVRLTNAAVINAETENAFRGGDITINIDTFDVTEGGQVITTATNRGRAGNITLNVTDRTTLSSFDRNYADRPSNRVSNQGAASGLFANTGGSSSGQGGSIRIITRQLEVSDRARVVVNSQGDGVAGDIDITAQSVQLDRGDLTAETQRDEVDGGNIMLRNSDLLLLRNGSSISTNAGGNGGNIDIDADFIVAVPTANSDISANAIGGNGGNVNITSEGLFGIEARETETNLSDITATSERGVQGDININTPDVDPSRGLVELPIALVDVSNQIAQSCPTNGDVAGELGAFVVTGRGGIPANPAEILGGETILTDLAEIEGEEAEGQENGESTDKEELDRVSATAQAEIIEAQGWVVGADGKVILTAENPADEPHRPTIAPILCPKS
jgi:filamentous hemagglutinin family protein